MASQVHQSPMPVFSRTASHLVAKAKQPFNPFYVLVVAVGVVFFVTAFAYGAMTYLAIQPAGAGKVGSHELWSFLDRHGVRLLGVELGILAGASYGAMWLDAYRLRQNPGETSAVRDDPTKAGSGPKIR